MRKIILSTSFFPTGKDSKVPAFVKEQVEALVSEYPDLEIIVFTPHSATSSAEAMIQDERPTGYRVVRFHYCWPHRLQCFGDDGILPSIKRNPMHFLLLPLLFGFQCKALYKLCKKLEPDLIYSHWFTPQGVTGQLVSLLTKIPHVLTSHSTDIQVWNKIPILGPALVRYLLPKMHRISVVSEGTRDKLKKFFTEKEWDVLEKKVTIIPMGLKYSKFVPVGELTKTNLKVELGLTGKTVLLFVGRLVEKKGVCFLLDAFALLVNENPDLYLVIAGEGPLLDNLQNQAFRLGVAGMVSFPGFISGKEKHSYFQIAELLLLPSIVTSGGDCEGLPVVLMEGMASGILCLATAESGANTLIVDGENGFLVRSENEESITRKVREVLDLSVGELQSVRENGRQTAKKFDWNRIASEHHKLFSL